MSQAWTADNLPAHARSWASLVSALGTLLRLTLRQHARGRRLYLLVALFALPAIFVGVARYTQVEASAEELEFALVFTLMPHALLPLAALLYASGMVQDEVEEQTLTYLLVRPLPRWAVYAMKLAATWLVTALLAGGFALVTEFAVFAGPHGIELSVWTRALTTAGLFGLALWTYCALFGCLSLFARRSLILGFVYIAVMEGLIANMDFVSRQATVMYYFRVLAIRWLDLRAFSDWAIDLQTAPMVRTCVLVLAGAGLVFAPVAAAVFGSREFRLKTPEAS